MKRWTLLVLVVALVAVACGDNQSLVPPGSTAGQTQTTLAGSDTTGGLEPTTTAAPDGGGALAGDEQALADAIGAAAAAEMGGELPIDADEFGSCMGAAVVGALGMQRLNELGISVGNTGSIDTAFDALTPAELQAVLNAMAPCLNTPEVRNLLVQEMVATGISQGASECMVDAFLAPDVLGQIVGLALSGDEQDISQNQEFVTMMTTIMYQCLSPEELADLMGGGG